MGRLVGRILRLHKVSTGDEKVGWSIGCREESESAIEKKMDKEKKRKYWNKEEKWQKWWTKDTRVRQNNDSC